MRLKIEKRLTVSVWLNLAVPVFSVIMAFIVGGFFLYFQGVSPIKAYEMMFISAFGSYYDLSETVVKTLPLAMVSLSAMLCYTMLIWNIGAEGQALIGALAAAAMVRYFPTDNKIIMLSSMALAAAAAGGLWAGIAGLLKGKWNVNEIISTLMMNYIAIRLLEYFVYGPWRDPSSLGFPMTPPFIDSARLPTLWDSRIHIGIYALIILTVIMWLLLRKSQFGYEIRVMGNNPRAAHYAGMNYERSVIFVMFLSGTIAGFAGMCEVSGLQGRLQAGFSAEYGYTAIIVAWLSHLNPLVSLLTAFLMGALLVGGEALQIMMGLPMATATILQGLILFFVLAGEFFYSYKISWDTRGKI